MGRKKNHRKVHKKMLAVILVLLAVLTAALWLIKNKVEPNLEEVGRLRANVMVSQIINKALNDQLYSQDEMDELLIRQTDSDGKTDVLQANAQAMNILMTEISLELQEEYAARPVDVYAVPVGTLLGDKILSQTEPKVDIRIMPISVSSMDFKTEIESAGINQTKYKVYLDMSSQVKVVAPLVSDTFQVSTTVMIAEAVILGSVPDSYVNVPEEDILDVTNE